MISIDNYTFSRQLTWQGGDLKWGTSPIKSLDFWTKWTHDKKKQLNLDFHNTNGHQFWQSIDLEWSISSQQDT